MLYLYRADALFEGHNLNSLHRLHRMEFVSFYFVVGGKENFKLKKKINQKMKRKKSILFLPICNENDDQIHLNENDY